jgi:hypothetical protein
MLAVCLLTKYLSTLNIFGKKDKRLFLFLEKEDICYYYLTLLLF